MGSIYVKILKITAIMDGVGLFLGSAVISVAYGPFLAILGDLIFVTGILGAPVVTVILSLRWCRSWKERLICMLLMPTHLPALLGIFVAFVFSFVP